MNVWLWNVSGSNVLIICNCSWGYVRVISTQTWACHVARTLNFLGVGKCIWGCDQNIRTYEWLWNVGENLHVLIDSCCIWVWSVEMF